MGNKQRGFNLIELIITMVLVAVIAAAGASFMIFSLQDLTYIPNALRIDMATADALDIMVEGDPALKGLRFCKSINNPILDNQLTFTNQDGVTITYQLNSLKLYRNGSFIPYYAGLKSGINFLGLNNKLFTYYDKDDAVINDPLQADKVRYITIHLISKTNSGDFSSWQGSSQVTTSIVVNR